MFKVLLIASVLAFAMAYEAQSEVYDGLFARQDEVNALAPAAFTEEQADGPSADDQAAGPDAADQAAGPDERDTNNVNAKRQHGVNKKALYYGAGVGTAPYYGVPGTDKKGYHNAHYAAPAYGAYGYGHHGAYNGAHRGAYNGAYHGAYNGAHRGAHYGAYPAYGYAHGYNAGYGRH